MTAAAPRFEPRPPNDFARFIRIYFDRCRAACPKVKSLAGKWRFEDLIPGLSDFDTRLIVADDTTVEDWAEMSLAVGRVHTELAREFPGWARIVEHLPGLNLSYAEMTDPIGYYPEFQHWTFYHGEAAPLELVRSYLAARAWDERDEVYQLKRFATYFGPYCRGIDPPVNVGPWENKYPLHSRYLHYFTPAVQAAVSLLQRRAVTGKLEALRLAAEILPDRAVIDGVLDVVDRHYEIPQDYEEPRLREIEQQLERYLINAYREIASAVTCVALRPQDATPSQLKATLAKLPAHPAQEYFDGVRFCRLMRGRLLFYAETIPGFDSAFLIRNELGRIVQNFYATPLRVYGQARFAETLEPGEVLLRLRGNVLPAADCDGIARFATVASLPVADAQERQQARAVAATLDPVLRVTEALGRDLRCHLETVER